MVVETSTQDPGKASVEEHCGSGCRRLDWLLRKGPHLSGDLLGFNISMLPITHGADAGCLSLGFGMCRNWTAMSWASCSGLSRALSPAT